MTGPLPNAASCAIFSGGALLLIQRTYPPYKGYWTLPGGRMEAGETPEECARREVGEELGLSLGRLLPVTLCDGGGGFLLQVFAAKIDGGGPVPSDEIADWRWTEPGELHRFQVTPDFPAIVAKAARTLALPTPE